MFEAEETFYTSQVLNRNTQLHLHTPLQVITDSTGGKEP